MLVFRVQTAARLLGNTVCSGSVYRWSTCADPSPESIRLLRRVLTGAAALGLATSGLRRPGFSNVSCDGPLDTRNSSPSVHLWFVRHAETTNNLLHAALDKDEYRRVRSLDAGLTQRGLKQTQHVATHPALKAFFSHDAPQVELLASPLHRAIQTGAALQCALPSKPELRLRVDLCETGAFGFPDTTPETLTARFPDVHLNVSELPPEGWFAHSAIESGDTKKAAVKARAARVAAWLRELRPTASTDRHIIIVTHGSFFNALLKEFLEAPKSVDFVLSNCGVTHLELNCDSQILRMHCMNWELVELATP